jgi:hypothetical protein
MSTTTPGFAASASGAPRAESISRSEIVEGIQDMGLTAAYRELNEKEAAKLEMLYGKYEAQGGTRTQAEEIFRKARDREVEDMACGYN